jgi:hypothetical protein
MLHKAIAAGLPIKETAIADHESKINLESPLHPPRDFIPNEYRGFLKGDRFHYTVKARPNHHNPPNECVRETEEDELRAILMTALPPRDAGSTVQPMPGGRLEVGQHIEKEVLARHCWNTVGIAVQKGERYDVTATGTWKDKDHESTAAGDPAPNRLMRRFDGTKRVAQAPWFCLIAAVHPSHTLEFQHSDAINGLTDFVVETLGRSVKKHDAESQLVSVGAQGSIEVDRDGSLYLFANDAAWAYANNSGSIKAIIERQQ